MAMGGLRLVLIIAYLVVLTRCFQFASVWSGKSGVRSHLRMSTKERDRKEGKSARTFYIETHGCQMNLADSEIVRSVLGTAGFEQGEVLEEADLILTNTCAIRENAEAKVWQRLKYFQSLRKANKKRNREAKSANGLDRYGKPDGYPIIGVLGCMAERLKTQLMEKAEVDFIAGPDAYRDLPNLLNIVDSSTDAKAANTALSLEETYADIQPVRLAEGNTHAFVTITRGCNNKCSFCVVPYTRGVERSRPVESILREVTQLREEGYKEVVLLGQNVNSYYYNGETAADAEDRESGPSLLNVMPQQQQASSGGQRESKERAVRDTNLADGFSQRWKPKPVDTGSLHLGVPFSDLLKQVSEIDPEMRIRFQAPHPKDFPDDVLHLIAESPNICNSLHMPAQSGSTTMLERMHRGYTREAYLALIKNAREIIARDTPEHVGLGISSDFISGFCGETEEEHRDTVTMMQQVEFDQAFTYSYSMREQTYAGLFLEDDVPDHVKSSRLTELIDTFQSTSQSRNSRLEIGRLHVVLVEGEAKSKGHSDDKRRWTGRTDSNKRVVFPDSAVLLEGLTQQEANVLKSMPIVKDHDDITAGSIDTAIKQMIASKGGRASRGISKGEYVVVKISGNRGHTLRGVPVATTSNTHAHALKL